MRYTLPPHPQKDCSMVKDRSKPLHLEDFTPGETFRTGSFTVNTALIREFAAFYDPQPMHLDEEAGRASLFGALVGSGWQTLALTMRLMVEARFLGTTPIIGAEFRDMRFARPMRPGDLLTAEAEILGIRPSRSRPERGFMDVRVITRNHKDEVLVEQTWTLLVPTRP